MDNLINFLSIVQRRKNFFSWNKTERFLDNNELTLWEEVGEKLEERTICEKCGSKIKTNSEERLKYLKESHKITCPERMSG